MWSNDSVDIDTYKPPLVTYHGYGEDRSFDEKDRELWERFVGIVGDIALADVVQMSRGQPMPKHFETNYEIVPITALQTSFATLNSMRKDYTKPAHIRCDYRGPGGKITGDAGLGIGLAHRQQLEAVAVAGLAIQAQAIKVVQIQGVGPSRPDAQRRAESGLYAGFEWRQALLRCWEKVAKELDIPKVMVQTARRNIWGLVNGSDPAVKGPAFYAYDDVAKAMGYQQLTTASPNTSGNWVKEL